MSHTRRKGTRIIHPDKHCFYRVIFLHILKDINTILVQLHCFAVHKDMAEFGRSARRIRVVGGPRGAVSCEVRVVFF